MKSLEVRKPGRRPASSATSVFGNCTIFVSLQGIIDFELEKERLNKEIGKVTKELEGINKKLSNEDFLQKAPQEVVQKVGEKGEKLGEKRKKLEDQLGTVSQMSNDQA